MLAQLIIARLDLVVKHAVQPHLSPVIHILVKTAVRWRAATAHASSIRREDVWHLDLHLNSLFCFQFAFSFLFLIGGICKLHIFRNDTIETATRRVDDLLANVHLARHIFPAKVELIEKVILRFLVRSHGLPRCLRMV